MSEHARRSTRSVAVTLPSDQRVEQLERPRRRIDHGSERVGAISATGRDLRELSLDRLRDARWQANIVDRRHLMWIDIDSGRVTDADARRGRFEFGAQEEVVWAIAALATIIEANDGDDLFRGPSDGFWSTEHFAIQGTDGTFAVNFGWQTGSQRLDVHWPRALGLDTTQNRHLNPFELAEMMDDCVADLVGAGYAWDPAIEVRLHRQKTGPTLGKILGPYFGTP